MLIFSQCYYSLYHFFAVVTSVSAYIYNGTCYSVALLARSLCGYRAAKKLHLLMAKHAIFFIICLFFVAATSLCLLLRLSRFRSRSRTLNYFRRFWTHKKYCLESILLANIFTLSTLPYCHFVVHQLIFSGINIPSIQFFLLTNFQSTIDFTKLKQFCTNYNFH